jgi:hypothetical protein
MSQEPGAELNVGHLGVAVWAAEAVSARRRAVARGGGRSVASGSARDTELED